MAIKPFLIASDWFWEGWNAKSSCMTPRQLKTKQIRWVLRWTDIYVLLWHRACIMLFLPSSNHLDLCLQWTMSEAESLWLTWSAGSVFLPLISHHMKGLLPCLSPNIVMRSLELGSLERRWLQETGATWGLIWVILIVLACQKVPVTQSISSNSCQSVKGQSLSLFVFKYLPRDVLSVKLYADVQGSCHSRHRSLDWTTGYVINRPKNLFQAMPSFRRQTSHTFSAPCSDWQEQWWWYLSTWMHTWWKLALKLECWQRLAWQCLRFITLQQSECIQKIQH